jgi:uncharacterized tellurite resistance protein B-like protein
MLDKIIKFLSEPSPPENRDGLQTAVAVLLVEAARMDSHFDDAERGVIERLLAHKFQLSPEQTRELLQKAVAIDERSNQLYPFTRTAVERMTAAQRIGLIEMLWEVAYADGVLDPDEDALLRRIAGLIYVSDVDRAAARIRVLDRLGKRE